MLRVIVARFISRTGGEAAFIVGVWGKAAFVFKASPGQLALLMAVLSVTTIAGSLVAGVLVDRYDPRRVLAAAELVFVPVALSMAAASSLAQLTWLTALLGFFGAPVMTAVAAFGPFLTEDAAGLQRLNAALEAAGSIAFVVGPAVGALMLSFVPLDWVFVLDAATSAVAVVLVVQVTLKPRSGKAPARESTNPFAELAEGLRASYGRRALRFYLLAGTAVWLGFGAFGALEPLFYRDVLHSGVQTLALVNAVFGLGIFAGSALLPALPRRLMSARGFTLVGVLLGLGTVLYVGTADIRVVVAGAVLWAIVIGIAEPMLRTLIQTDSPDELVGRIAGTSLVHQHAGELLPLAVAPVLATRFGVQPVLIGGGLALSVAALLAFGEAAAVDRLPRLREPEPLPISARDEPISPTP
jgi:MFS family permease